MGKRRNMAYNAGAKTKKKRGKNSEFSKMYGEGLEMHTPLDDVVPKLHKCKSCGLIMSLGYCQSCEDKESTKTNNSAYKFSDDGESSEEEKRTDSYSSLMNRLLRNNNKKTNKLKFLLAQMKREEDGLASDATSDESDLEDGDHRNCVVSSDGELNMTEEEAKEYMRKNAVELVLEGEEEVDDDDDDEANSDDTSNKEYEKDAVKSEDENITSDKDIDDTSVDEDDDNNDPYRMHFDNDALTDDIVMKLQLNTTIKYQRFKADPDQWGNNWSNLQLNLLVSGGSNRIPDKTEFKDARSNFIKSRLWPQIQSHLPSNFQQCVFPILSQYKDALFPIRSKENHHDILSTLSLHVMNHTLKARDSIVKHNNKLRQAAVEQKKSPKSDFSVLEYRDQGFTRPKVLVILPFRSSALKFVQKLMQWLPKGAEISNKSRFLEEFGVEEEDEDVASINNDSRSAPNRPEQWNYVFDGNTDDCFKLGIQVSRKSMRLFSDFYSSDIILASPLGLRLVVGAEGDKARDFDFLSSIEMCIVDEADVLQMQNFEHVKEIFKIINRMPSRDHGTDFSRVREWYLQGWAKHYRQTIVVSEHMDAELKHVFHRQCNNYSGRVQLIPEYDGVIKQVVIPAKQIFRRIDVTSISKQADCRFEFFIEHLLPQLKSAERGTLVFIPSYFDFVRVRNLLQKEIPGKFVNCCEYTRSQDVTRARGKFFHGKVNILLTTSRFHFFRRYRIRGVRSIVFYSIPNHEHFYDQMMNIMVNGDGSSPASIALFSKYDAMQLERIVGSSRYRKMLLSDKSTFMFC